MIPFLPVTFFILNVENVHIAFHIHAFRKYWIFSFKLNRVIILLNEIAFPRNSHSMPILLVTSQLQTPKIEGYMWNTNCAAGEFKEKKKASYTKRGLSPTHQLSVRMCQLRCKGIPILFRKRSWLYCTFLYF